MSFLLFLLFSSELDISEVGGHFLVGSVTAHDKTYLLYQQGLMDFDVYLLDWESKKFVGLEKDGRIRMLGTSNLLSTQNGIAIISCGSKKLFELTKEGAFLRQADIRDAMEPEEQIYFAYSHEERIYLVTKLEGHMLLSELDPRGTREIVFRVEEPGSFYILDTKQGRMKIRYNVGQVDILDQNFVTIHASPTLFEEIEQPKGLIGKFKDQDSQLVRFPIYAAETLTMRYQVKKGGKKMTACARFDGKQFQFSRYRPIATSPNKSELLIYDFEEDKLRFAPASFKYQETKIPPMPN